MHLVRKIFSQILYYGNGFSSNEISILDVFNPYLSNATMRVWMGGSGIHYSLKIKPIIHLIKNLGYS